MMTTIYIGVMTIMSFIIAAYAMKTLDEKREMAAPIFWAALGCWGLSLLI